MKTDKKRSVETRFKITPGVEPGRGGLKLAAGAVGERTEEKHTTDVGPGPPANSFEVLVLIWSMQQIAAY